jgi:hypothetical protein
MVESYSIEPKARGFISKGFEFARVGNKEDKGGV